MINKNYFKNLISSNRYLILFIALITSLTVFTNDHTAFLSVLLNCLSFFMPIYVLKFIHDKKSVDTYFSLPVSRKELLNTSLLFCLIVSYIPNAIGQVVCNVIYVDYSIPSLLIALLLELIVSCAIILFVSLIYTIANNIFDGIVIIGAYSLLPLALFIVVTMFFEVFVCGFNSNIEFDVFGYISPIYLGILLQTRNLDVHNIVLNSNDFIYLFLIVGYICLCYFGIFKYFLKMKTEKAGSSSNNFFAYPFVIYTYTFLCLFGISANYSLIYYGLLDFLEEFFIAYLIVFALFIIAHFIYKRKFYLSFETTIFFVAAVVLSLFFCSCARTTKGFGISNLYEKANSSTRYVVYASDEKEISDYVSKKLNIGETYTSINIEIGGKGNETDEYVINLVENYRKTAIEQFYSRTRTEYKNYMRLEVYNNYEELDDLLQYSNSYNYVLDNVIDLSTLLELAKHDGVKIIISVYNGDYLLSKNGDLLLLNLYNSYEDVIAYEGF